MKPYGKKPKKSRLSIHSSDECDVCSNNHYKISKTRERQNNEEVDDFFNSEEITQYDELEKTIQVYLEQDNVFRSCSNLHDLTATSCDPETAIEKLTHKIYNNGK